MCPNQSLRFRKQSDWERENGLIFLFFLGLTSFPRLCVNIGAKNYMAYIKERREYLFLCIGLIVRPPPPTYPSSWLQQLVPPLQRWPPAPCASCSSSALAAQPPLRGRRRRGRSWRRRNAKKSAKTQLTSFARTWGIVQGQRIDVKNARIRQVCASTTA